MKVDNLILEKALGEGSFGEVFLTKIEGKDKYYATKKLDRKIEKTDAFKYLKNEIYILQKLNHPNIVKYENIKKTSKHFYIVMEYCNGGELSKALEKYQEKYGKPFSQEIVQHIMRQIIDAFKYIHSQKIIHRDIKLENILLNFESQKDKEDLNMMKATVKIIDFGFACVVNKSNLMYSILGSPINMDPIILKKLSSKNKGKARELGYDQKADIWSLGTICYEMIIGKSAFDSESMDELVEKIEKGTYTIPTSLSKEIISFINGMIQYDPNARLSCEDLSKHPFLTKDVKDFTSSDMKTKDGEDSIKIDFKESKSIHKSIWAFYKESDEEKLIKISGYEFDKDKQQNKEPIKRTNSQEKIPLNNDNMTPNDANHNPPIRRNTVQYETSNLMQFNPMYVNNFNNNNNYNNNYNNLPQSQNYGPMLSYPYQRIPGNPVNNVQIMPMPQNSQYVNQVFNDETEYSFGGGIYSK